MDARFIRITRKNVLMIFWGSIICRKRGFSINSGEAIYKCLIYDAEMPHSQHLNAPFTRAKCHTCKSLLLTALIGNCFALGIYARM